jgi:hypothetical protein
MSESSTSIWDGKDCPRNGCDGELQQQDRINVMCLSLVSNCQIHPRCERGDGGGRR